MDEQNPEFIKSFKWSLAANMAISMLAQIMICGDLKDVTIQG
jgi:hypothetical protein